MLVDYGRGPIPEGRLPVFSVDTEDEARKLLTLTCPTNLLGQFVAPELAHEQTLENLDKFGKRLAKGYALMKRNERTRHARSRKSGHRG